MNSSQKLIFATFIVVHLMIIASLLAYLVYLNYSIHSELHQSTEASENVTSNQVFQDYAAIAKVCPLCK